MEEFHFSTETAMPSLILGREIMAMDCFLALFPEAKEGVPKCC
jgi:hypothetical protein